MSLHPIPSIGTTGYYIAKEPFNNIIKTNEVYKCHAIRSLDELNSAGEDPLLTIYRYNTLTDEDYNRDLDNNVLVIILLSNSGNWLYIPNSYLDSYPISSGVPYQSKAIVVPIGALPVDLELNGLRLAISEIVLDMIGVDTTTNVIETSTEIIVGYEIDSENRNMRDNFIRNKVSYKTKYYDLLEQLRSMTLYINNLECYVRTRGCSDECGEIIFDNTFSFNSPCLHKYDVSMAEYMFLQDTSEYLCQGADIGPRGSPNLDRYIVDTINPLIEACGGGEAHLMDAVIFSLRK